jgi:low affinity Fe/Cu permease
MPSPDECFRLLTYMAGILAAILFWIACYISEYKRFVQRMARQSGSSLPRFSLAILLYVVTAVAVFIRVITAFPQAGGFALFSLIGGGIALHLWRQMPILRRMKEEQLRRSRQNSAKELT